jgi:hypothetical protein
MLGPAAFAVRTRGVDFINTANGQLIDSVYFRMMAFCFSSAWVFLVQP